jgi:hypothetical protein
VSAIGSNVARSTFKTMLTTDSTVCPDYVCHPAGAVPYESAGVINGMQRLPATFTAAGAWDPAWRRPSTGYIADL